MNTTQIYDYLKEAVLGGGKQSPLYISGVPGTGKTATVYEVGNTFCIGLAWHAYTSGDTEVLILLGMGVICLTGCRSFGDCKTNEIRNSFPTSEYEPRPYFHPTLVP